MQQEFTTMQLYINDEENETRANDLRKAWIKGYFTGIFYVAAVVGLVMLIIKLYE